MRLGIFTFMRCAGIASSFVKMRTLMTHTGRTTVPLWMLPWRKRTLTWIAPISIPIQKGGESDACSEHPLKNFFEKL
jgi:hypothetical protein